MPLETIWIQSDVCTVSRTQVSSIFAALEAYYNMVTRISGRSVDKQLSSAEKFSYTGLFSLNNIIDGQMAKKKVRPYPQLATYTHDVELVLFIATIWVHGIEHVILWFMQAWCEDWIRQRIKLDYSYRECGPSPKQGLQGHSWQIQVDIILPKEAARKLTSVLTISCISFSVMQSHALFFWFVSGWSFLSTSHRQYSKWWTYCCWLGWFASTTTYYTPQHWRSFHHLSSFQTWMCINLPTFIYTQRHRNRCPCSVFWEPHLGAGSGSRCLGNGRSHTEWDTVKQSRKSCRLFSKVLVAWMDYANSWGYLFLSCRLTRFCLRERLNAWLVLWSWCKFF